MQPCSSSNFGNKALSERPSHSEPHKTSNHSLPPLPAECIPLPPPMTELQAIHPIIPCEDAQAGIELPPLDNSEDTYSGLMEDGLCEDNKMEDEDDPTLEPADETSNPSQAHHCPPPSWLLSAFQQKITECRNRDTHGFPPLYHDLQTFWFPCPSPYFILRRNHVSPENLMIPRFFLWDPEPLCGGIPCPNCSKRLYRHDHVEFPRRCVDLDGSFWIIGFRYRCPGCTSAKGASATFRSWDSRILAMLPSALAAEFPARLSWRSGISRPLFTFMRSCFQNGMGAKQFADALRVQQLQKYDELHLQYLHSLAARRRGLSAWQGEKFDDFLPFKDRSPKGPHGYVPSSQWLRDMYDCFIEEHQDQLNQHTAMLSAEICAIDHSHKVY
ncbi:hypothetical protein BYT27DRAFT_7095404 [Phlegmacium glaucopus]|nr:hypothetical protein BYT27DRAFT_7095404 [Phlegmacium glaucopus]